MRAMHVFQPLKLFLKKMQNRCCKMKNLQLCSSHRGRGAPHRMEIKMLKNLRKMAKEMGLKIIAERSGFEWTYRLEGPKCHEEKIYKSLDQVERELFWIDRFNPENPLYAA